MRQQRNSFYTIYPTFHSVPCGAVCYLLTALENGQELDVIGAGEEEVALCKNWFVAMFKEDGCIALEAWEVAGDVGYALGTRAHKCTQKLGVKSFARRIDDYSVRIL